MHQLSRLFAVTALTFAWMSCSGGTSDDDHVNDMAEEHADDAPESNEMSDASPSMDVTTEAVTFGTVDGVDVQGYLARPAGVEGPLPGIIVIHEWWGLQR